MAGRQNCSEDVRTGESGYGGTVQNCQKEQTRCAEMAKRREKRLMARLSSPLQQEIEHLGNIPIDLERAGD